MSGENTARDYSDELSAARNAGQQSPATFHVPRAADNYAQNPEQLPMNNAGLRSAIRNGASEAEKFLPHEFREKLDEVRRDYHEAKQLGVEAKTLVKSMTPWGFFSLIGKVHPLTDMPYFFAILAAVSKDLLDLAGIGSLPGIGTVVTMLASTFIAMMMFLGNVVHSEHDRTIFQSVLLKQFGVLILVTIVEFIFGLDFVPAETLGVLFIYSFALAARKGRDAVISE